MAQFVRSNSCYPNRHQDSASNQFNCYVSTRPCTLSPHTTEVMLPALLQEEVPMSSCSIICLLYLRDSQCLVAGCDDGLIHVHYLNGHVPMANDHPLPTTLAGHEAKIIGLVQLADGLLLSASHDRSMRVWDLATMKQVHVRLLELAWCT